ncbi:MAG: YihY/virulence factor BrkB family protein [Ornithinimicrobium sp.]|jgi:membrane protein|uniref:YihY/virulence factor BrkB family protein n=1 Tax=Ornithinimicrobium sp. TaxID=1977084 RepID=UPI003D9B1D31
MAQALDGDTAADAAPGEGGAVAPGARAAAPHRIPRDGWRQILHRVRRRIMADQFPLFSAGVAFFAVLSIAPVLVTALAVYGVLNTPAQAMAQLNSVADLLPEQLEEVMAGQLTSISAASAKVLTVQGVVALVIALWTATAAMNYLIDALTLAYHEQETRSFRRRVLLALGFVLGGAVLLGMVLTATSIVGRAEEGAPPVVYFVVELAIWVGMAALMVVLLSVLYRFAPDRKGAQWRWVSGGAVLATGCWLAMSTGLFAYVRSLGTYERTYGSLAGVAISMLWLWMTVLLVIIGAAVNAEAERQTARDSTVGPEESVGERGAVVADSIPPYPGDD